MTKRELRGLQGMGNKDTFFVYGNLSTKFPFNRAHFDMQWIKGSQVYLLLAPVITGYSPPPPHPSVCDGLVGKQF